MKCYVCGHEAKEFGQLGIGGDGCNWITGRINGENLGPVTVFVCPNCGDMHSDMKGHIKAEDRKPG